MFDSFDPEPTPLKERVAPILEFQEAPEPEESAPLSLPIENKKALPPEQGDIADNIVMWYLFDRDWDIAAQRAGFSPSDRKILKKAQKRFEEHRDYFEQTIQSKIAEGFMQTSMPDAILDNTRAVLIDMNREYLMFLARDKQIFRPGTLPKTKGKMIPSTKRAITAAKADSLVLDVMRKGAEVLALFDSITKPQEKAVEARMV